MIVICVQTLAPTTGSGQFTNDVVNLKHQGAGQKLMIGWHKHQGVSETPKNADVICEQPLIEQNEIIKNILDATTTNLLGGPDIGCSFFVCRQKLKNNISN